MTDDTKNPGGWPDPARPGVPLNPKKDGWHWVAWHNDPPDVMWWTPHGPEHRGQCWLWDGDWTGPGWVAPQARYLGPALLPAEVAALVAEAHARALDEAAAVVEREASDEWPLDDANRYAAAALRSAATAIRALKEKTT